MEASNAVLLAIAVVVTSVALGVWLRGWFAEREKGILENDLDLAYRRIRQLECELSTYTWKHRR